MPDTAVLRRIRAGLWRSIRLLQLPTVQGSGWTSASFAILCPWVIRLFPLFPKCDTAAVSLNVDSVLTPQVQALDCARLGKELPGCRCACFGLAGCSRTSVCVWWVGLWKSSGLQEEPAATMQDAESSTARTAGRGWRAGVLVSKFHRQGTRAQTPTGLTYPRLPCGQCPPVMRAGPLFYRHLGTMSLWGGQFLFGVFCRPPSEDRDRVFRADPEVTRREQTLETTVGHFQRPRCVCSATESGWLVRACWNTITALLPAY